jgi:hypothetical protein
MKNLILLTMLASASCSSEKEDAPAARQIDLMLAPQLEMEVQAVLEKTTVARKLIREGKIEFETSDVEKTRSRIMDALSANNGYVSSDEESRSPEKTSYALVVRIPYLKFDNFLNSATKGVAYFNEKKICVKDVTAEYTDTEIRLKTKKEIEARYLQLLARASSVKDVLNIEKEAGVVRAEIESAEGQLILLKDQIQYSTLWITFYKTHSTPQVFSSRISSAGRQGWENLLASFLIVINVWPFVVLLAGLFFVLRYLIARKRKRRTPQAV